MGEDNPLLARLKKDFPWFKRIFPFIICFGFGFLSAVYLYSEFVIPGKEETIRTISEQRTGIERENGKLSKEVEQLRIYRGQDAPPLKQKALIFVRQVRELSKDWKDSDAATIQSGNVMTYLARFGLRASILRDDLDQSGQQSPELDKLMYDFPNTYFGVRSLANAIEKLANNLPD